MQPLGLEVNAQFLYKTPYLRVSDMTQWENALAATPHHLNWILENPVVNRENQRL